MTEEASLYDQIGGEAAVDAAVELFYRKVLSDYRIRCQPWRANARAGSPQKA